MKMQIPVSISKTDFLGYRFLVPCVILMLGLDCGEVEGREKPPAQIYKTDLWAGQTVRDSAFVSDMMLNRIHNAPKEGEKAPQFVLKEAKTGETRALSELYAKKPVVLFFGSGSCGITQGSSESIKKLWKRFGDEVDFYMIYIREAHAEGGFGSADSGPQIGTKEAKEFIAVDAQTEKQRAVSALAFGENKEIEFPILIDRMDDATIVRWGAWPVRLFFIDTSGTVLFSGQQGPWFHKPVRSYVPELDGVPMNLKNIPGYSRISLEGFLENTFPKKRAVEEPQR